MPGSGRSPGEGNGNPLQYSCLENPMDRAAWRVTVHGVIESRTRLSHWGSACGQQMDPKTTCNSCSWHFFCTTGWPRGWGSPLGLCFFTGDSISADAGVTSCREGLRGSLGPEGIWGAALHTGWFFAAMQSFVSFPPCRGLPAASPVGHSGPPGRSDSSSRRRSPPRASPGQVARDSDTCFLRLQPARPPPCP